MEVCFERSLLKQPKSHELLNANQHSSEHKLMVMLKINNDNTYKHLTFIPPLSSCVNFILINHLHRLEPFIA